MALKYIILDITERHSLEAILVLRYNFNIKICKMSKSAKLFE